MQVKAEYRDGVLRPLETLELAEGAIVTLQIEENQDTGQKTHSILETANRIRQAAPPGTWDKVPTDASINYRHYMYGHPKDEG